jgi:aspartate aminotransferase
MKKTKPKVSLRGAEAPFSPIRKFVPLLQKVKKRGINVYEIHIGQPDLPTPNQILNKIKRFKGKRLVYTPSGGTPELKAAWQKYYKNLKINFKLSEIISTIGGSEAILFSFLAVAGPGDEIIVFEPFYTTYNGYAAMTGVKLLPLTTSVKTGFHLPDKRDIERKITKKTKAILICNPNNPTGTVYKRKELETIVGIADKYNLFILSDETYRELVYGREKHYSIMDFKKAHLRAVLLDSVSKRFSVCGARIGCLASKNKDVLEAVTKFSQTRLSLPQIEQGAVISLLENSKKYTRKIVGEYKKRRDTVFKELQKIEGIKCMKPKGAFYVIAKLPVKDSEHFTEWLLSRFSFKGETVMVAPASGFYATKGLGKDEIRIAFVLSSPKLKRAIRLLGIALKKYEPPH